MKHRPVRKRGAVELSMTTVIVVVLGITLLTLGLRWIYSIFGGLGSQQEQLQKLTEEQIIELFGGSTSAINMPQMLASVEQQKKINLRVLMRNVYEEPHTFRYEVVVDSVPSGVQSLLANRLTWSRTQIPLKSGEGFLDFITFDSRGLPLGTYRFRVKLHCLDCGVESEESLPVIIDVASK